MNNGRSCAVIPAYNEEKGLEKVLNSVLNLIPCYLYQTIVVDDGSKDKTADVASKYQCKGVILLRHEKNRGKAAALKTGIEKALEFGYDLILTLDADGQHLPQDIPLLLNKINEGYDLVIGERDFNKMPFWNMIANIIDAGVTSSITKKRITDSQCGFRAIRSRLFHDGKINLKGERFTIESEMILQAAINDYKIGFVGISTEYNSDRKSKIKVMQQISDYFKMYKYYMSNGRKK